MIRKIQKQTFTYSIPKQYISCDLSLPTSEELAMTICNPFEHWRVCSYFNKCQEKVGRFCGWVRLAWAQLLVNLKLVSDRLGLLVLLQIRALEITVALNLTISRALNILN